MPGEQPRIRLPHPADTERVDEPFQRDRAPLFDRGQQGGDGFGLPALSPKQRVLMLGEAKDVGRRTQPATREQLGNGLVAQTLDIERGATDEMG